MSENLNGLSENSKNGLRTITYIRPSSPPELLAELTRAPGEARFVS